MGQLTLTRNFCFQSWEVDIDAYINNLSQQRKHGNKYMETTPV